MNGQESRQEVDPLQKQGPASTYKMPKKRHVENFVAKFYPKAEQLMWRLAEYGLGQLCVIRSRDELKDRFYKAARELEHSEEDYKTQDVQRDVMQFIGADMDADRIRAASKVIDKVFPSLHLVVEKMVVDDAFESKQSIVDKLTNIFVRNPKEFINIIEADETLRQMAMEHFAPKQIIDPDKLNVVYEGSEDQNTVE